MKSRKRYLESVPIEDALRRWLSLFPNASLESVIVEAPESMGRVVAEPIFARLSSPHYHASAMDGIAVRALSTFGASETMPMSLLRGKQFQWVDTGDPMPEGTDCVIMSEDISWANQDTVEITAAASPWQHVRPVGEDIVATELLFLEGHVISAADIGALLAAGIWNVPVKRPPVVAIVPTGDEIVEPSIRLSGAEADLTRGDIVESNSYVQAALVRSWGGSALRFSVVPDQMPELEAALDRALDSSDIVVLNAGSSAGSEDFTAEVIEHLGEVIVHGVAQRPGKPVILGQARGKPVIGVPGYPVSAYLTFCTFVKPLVEHLFGIPSDEGESLPATLTRRVASPAGVEEFLRVKVGSVSGKMVATPISRGAGVITSITRADGLVRIPRLSEGLSEGSTVSVRLMRPRREILSTVVVIGSHDPGLDLLGAYLKKSWGVGLSSSHTGSLGGLMAIRRGEAHAAGTHLIDEATGEYNTSWVSRLLPGERILLVTLAERHQGLIVRPGNPKSITSIDALGNGKIRIANRQRGAGTRILLDLMLKKSGIDVTSIPGYDREEFTHASVAVAVASGMADCGMGVLAAARALKQDFVPLTTELYELAIPEVQVDDPRVKAMIETIKDSAFSKALESLGGYDTGKTGTERWCGVDR